jgi:hypothetical protein
MKKDNINGTSKKMKEIMCTYFFYKLHNFSLQLSKSVLNLTLKSTFSKDFKMNFNNLQMHDEYSNTIIICGMKIFKGLFSYQIWFGFDA